MNQPAMPDDALPTTEAADPAAPPDAPQADRAAPSELTSAAPLPWIMLLLIAAGLTTVAALGLGVGAYLTVIATLGAVWFVLDWSQSSRSGRPT